MYTDYGPKPAAPAPDETAEQRTRRLRAQHRSRWASRPFCDMCGPFRGRYLRYMLALKEWRCRGCDRENGLED
jgi:hypothetical protein